MEAPAMPVAEAARKLNRWEEDELDLLAFELWKRASCPETDKDRDCVEAEEWRHASCL